MSTYRVTSYAMGSAVKSVEVEAWDGKAAAQDVEAKMPASSQAAPQSPRGTKNTRTLGVKFLY